MYHTPTTNTYTPLVLPYPYPPYAICPQSTTLTCSLGAPVLEPRASICFTTSMPALTLPKTTCLPSNQGVSTVVMKNYSMGMGMGIGMGEML